MANIKIHEDEIARLMAEFGISKNNARYKIFYYKKTGRDAFQSMLEFREAKKDIKEKNQLRDANRAKRIADKQAEREKVRPQYFIKSIAGWVEASTIEVDLFLKG